MATYSVTGYMTIHYHFCDVEVEADSENDIDEWDVIDNDFTGGWGGEMIDYTFETFEAEKIDD